MKIKAILAMGLNGEVGKNNDLVWKIPSDLEMFKELTTGHAVIMGYNTMLSLPKKHLPNRVNYVLSTREITDAPKEVIVVKNLAEAVNHNAIADKTIFVIGGATTYENLIPMCEEVYLTVINDEDREADTYLSYELFSIADWTINNEVYVAQTEKYPSYIIFHLKRRRW